MKCTHTYYFHILPKSIETNKRTTTNEPKTTTSGKKTTMTMGKTRKITVTTARMTLEADKENVVLHLLKTYEPQQDKKKKEKR